MKNRLVLWAFRALLLLLVPLSAAAGEMREVVLHDGSVITGEVVSLADGIYTVKSPTLGLLRIDERNVRAIGPSQAASAPEPAAGGPVPADIPALRERVQQKIVNDREIMAMVESLKDDPAFQEVLADPKLMRAVNEGDIKTLMADPRFMNLLNNATVKGIENRIR